ncbi:MAG: cytochrome c3 family protein [Syntrophorhabdales bacterium]|jgi:hypothetical protein
MKAGVIMGLVLSCLFFFCVSPVVEAANYPKEPVTIKLEGAKMPPVTFPHATHVEKQKIACVTCHHKDPQNPKACTVCHGMAAKGATPAARDAFHSRCQGCHKQMAAKGLSAPTKCMECHKR